VDEPLDPVIWRGRMFNGHWHEGAAGRCDVIEPATGKLLTQVGMASPADLSIAAQAASVAQALWAAQPARQRAMILRTAAQLLNEQTEALTRWLVRETGSVLVKAQHELREAASFFHLGAAMATQAAGQLLPSGPGTLSLGRRVPYGVVGIVTGPYFPLLESARSVAPALAAGNAVLLKPHLSTPVTGGVVIARVLEMAGLPAGVLHLVPGGDDCARELCRDRRVRLISYAGTRQEGRELAGLAAGHDKRVLLETRGRSTLVVLEDADLERAASNVAWAAFFHQGQAALAGTRVVAHARIAPDLIRRVAARAEALSVGDPAREEVALGPLLDRDRLDAVEAAVRDSLAAGAKVEAGGSHDGLFYRPTLLSRVRPGMPVCNAEFHGPVAGVIAVESDDEALALAAEGALDAAVAVFTHRHDRALVFADRVPAAMVHINDQPVNDAWTDAFGGLGTAANVGATGANPWHDYARWQWVTARAEPPFYPF
jgi:benzaldehyde dehydrogenase (NAD)